MDNSETNDPSQIRNEDPISGGGGAHPSGVGWGAFVRGASTDSVAGPVGEPIGATVGTLVGGVIGRLAAQTLAAQVDPTAESAYWKKHFHELDYVRDTTAFEAYEPAFRYGWESRARHRSSNFGQFESDLQNGWTQCCGASPLDWNSAKPAVEDAWQRVSNAHLVHKPR